MTKQELRTFIRRQKRLHSAEELLTLSRSIIHSLHRRIQKEENCQTVLLYHSLPDEVFTHDLVRTLAAEGKTVLLPTVVGDDLELHLYVGNDQMGTSASFGIQESTGPLFTDYSKIDLAVIPGMAFTRRGDRLGRGKGYYDRLLPRLSCPLVGLAFPFQMVDAIPCEPHDIRMHEVIADHTTLTTRR